jgi:hypothetical protein
MKRHKLQTLILLGIAVTTTILLAAGLSGLELLPGQPFTLSFLIGQAPTETEYQGPFLEGDLLLSVTRGIIIFFALLLPVIIILSIIYPEFRKRMLRRLISFVLFLLCLYLLLRLQPEILSPVEEIPPPDETAQIEGMPQEPTVESMPEPPQWLTPVASLCLALPVTALLAGLATRLLLHRKRHPARPLIQLAQEAENAIEQLQAGADLRNTVIRCYTEMTHVLAEQRGIERRRNMTTREFEAHLRSMGLPDEPVKRLTRLFEDVRYGTKVPGKLEERQAITSLTAIVEACKSSV